MFCGRVLPLDKEIMLKGSMDEKKEHLLEVITSFVQDRIERIFEMHEANPDAALPESEEANAAIFDDEFAPEAGETVGAVNVYGNAPEAPILPEELDSFRNVDLLLIGQRGILPGRLRVIRRKSRYRSRHIQIHPFIIRRGVGLD